MKKNVLARKILCGLLAAGVVGVSGSVMAAEYTDKNDFSGSYSDDTFKLTNTDKKYNIDADDKEISITSKEININTTSSVYGNLWAADAYGNGKLTLGGEKTESISIVAKNTSGSTEHVTYGILALDGNDKGNKPAYATVTAKNLFIDVAGVYASGIHVGNNTDQGDAPDNASSMTVKADKITINSTNVGVSAYSHGQMNLTGDLTINAERAIEARGNATMNINIDGQHKTVLNGDIVFGTPANPDDAHNSGSIINAYVNVNLTGAESSWTGSAYQEYKSSEAADYSHIVELVNDPFHGQVTGFKMNISDGATWNMTGDSFINDVTLADGGAINVQEGANLANLQKVTLDEGTINLQGENQKVNIIDNITGEGTVATNSLTNKVSVTSADVASGASIAVQGSSNITDAIASGQANLQQLANVVTSKDDENKSLASTVTSAANDIIGGYSADVKDGAVVAQSVKTVENTTNRAISDMASISLMTWRAENNDMNKRLGELRDSKGEHGAWARMARGESKYGAQNVKNQYNYYQVGYDEKLSVNPNWTVGVALTRTEGSSTFATGSGENKHTGVALYGSYLADNGSFIDLIAKYARMDNDYKTIGAGVGDADYETNGYSISAEYGKRFTKDNGFWIEPQVELTYGKVGSASYTTSKGALVNQDGIDSLVGRLGFSLGKDIKQGNVYVRASYLYDFDGETTAYMSKAGAGLAKFEQDLGGGWWEVGVGTNINLSDATHLYFDVEKTYGGNVATPWQWNAGVRWSF